MRLRCKVFCKRMCKNKIMDKMGEYSFNFSCYFIDVNKYCVI